MEDLLLLLAYLADPEKEVLLHSENPDEYILLEEYVTDLASAFRDVESRGLGLPAASPSLVQLLHEVVAEVSFEAIYNEGNTMYTDSSGNVIGDPNERWRAYVATSPKWKRAIELARSICSSL